MRNVRLPLSRPHFTGFANLTPQQLAVGLLLLCLPAFLLHLGLMAFTGDEAIRSLVALEMDLSGNFIAPTLHGAPYLNKPPLFNWCIWLAARGWGGFTEWPARLTTLAFLTLFCWLTYKAVRRHFDFSFAFLAALFIALNGRMLFYDSMLGLIDTAFSCTMYALFMSIYRYGREERWLPLFASSYALMGIGFLLKGFPALAFEGLTLIAGLLFFGKWKNLFSVSHLAGWAVAGLILGLYAWAYAQYRPLELLLPNLVVESTKRTILTHGPGPFFRHLIEFPLVQFYHFLPFSPLILFAFDRRVLQKIKENRFIAYNLLIMAVNLPVYWTSPEVRPRYLLMFIPLFTTVGLYLLDLNRKEGSWRFRFFFYFMGTLIGLAAGIAAALPFLPRANALPNIGWIAAGLALALAVLARLYFTDRIHFLWWLAAALLVLRLGFDLVVLPIRHDESIVTRARADVRRLADKYRDRQWWVYGNSEIREPASFYFTQRLGYIIRRTDSPNLPRALYLVNPNNYPDFPGHCTDTLQTDYENIRLLLYVTGP